MKSITLNEKEVTVDESATHFIVLHADSQTYHEIDDTNKSFDIKLEDKTWYAFIFYYTHHGDVIYTNVYIKQSGQEIKSVDETQYENVFDYLNQEMEDYEYKTQFEDDAKLIREIKPLIYPKNDYSKEFKRIKNILKRIYEKLLEGVETLKTTDKNNIRQNYKDVENQCKIFLGILNELKAKNTENMNQINKGKVTKSVSSTFEFGGKTFYYPPFNLQINTEFQELINNYEKQVTTIGIQLKNVEITKDFISKSESNTTMMISKIGLLRAQYSQEVFNVEQASDKTEKDIEKAFTNFQKVLATIRKQIEQLVSEYEKNKAMYTDPNKSIRSSLDSFYTFIDSTNQKLQEKYKTNVSELKLQNRQTHFVSLKPIDNLNITPEKTVELTNPQHMNYFTSLNVMYNIHYMNEFMNNSNKHRLNADEEYKLVTFEEKYTELAKLRSKDNILRENYDLHEDIGYKNFLFLVEEFMHIFNKIRYHPIIYKFNGLKKEEFNVLFTNTPEFRYISEIDMNSSNNDFDDESEFNDAAEKNYQLYTNRKKQDFEKAVPESYKNDLAVFKHIALESKRKHNEKLELVKDQLERDFQKLEIERKKIEDQENLLLDYKKTRLELHKKGVELEVENKNKVNDLLKKQKETLDVMYKEYNDLLSLQLEEYQNQKDELKGAKQIEAANKVDIAIKLLEQRRFANEEARRILKETPPEKVDYEQTKNEIGKSNPYDNETYPSFKNRILDMDKKIKMGQMDNVEDLSRQEFRKNISASDQNVEQLFSDIGYDNDKTHIEKGKTVGELQNKIVEIETYEDFQKRILAMNASKQIEQKDTTHNLSKAEFEENILASKKNVNELFGEIKFNNDHDYIENIKTVGDLQSKIKLQLESYDDFVKRIQNLDGNISLNEGPADLSKKELQKIIKASNKNINQLFSKLSNTNDGNNISSIRKVNNLQQKIRAPKMYDLPRLNRQDKKQQSGGNIKEFSNLKLKQLKKMYLDTIFPKAKEFCNFVNDLYSTDNSEQFVKILRHLTSESEILKNGKIYFDRYYNLDPTVPLQNIKPKKRVNLIHFLSVISSNNTDYFQRNRGIYIRTRFFVDILKRFSDRFIVFQKIVHLFELQEKKFIRRIDSFIDESNKDNILTYVKFRSDDPNHFNARFDIYLNRITENKISDENNMNGNLNSIRFIYPNENYYDTLFIRYNDDDYKYYENVDTDRTKQIMDDSVDSEDTKITTYKFSDKITGSQLRMDQSLEEKLKNMTVETAFSDSLRDIFQMKEKKTIGYTLQDDILYTIKDKLNAFPSQMYYTHKRTKNLVFPRYDHNYIFGKFTKIFQPKMSNEEIATNMNHIIDQLLLHNPVFILGYGASGSGKTSTLIYFNQAKINGIVIYIAEILAKKGYTELELCSEEFYDTQSYDVSGNLMNKTDPTIISVPAVSNPADISFLSFANTGAGFQLSDEYNHSNVHLYRNQKTKQTTFDETKTTAKNPDDAPLSERIKYEVEEKLRDKNPPKIEENQTEPVKRFEKATPLGEIMIHLVDTDRLVKATTNNVNSSRSHTLVYLTFKKAKSQSSKTGSIVEQIKNKIPDEDDKLRLIVGDFAGVENSFTCNLPTTVNQFRTILAENSDKYFYAKNAILINNVYDNGEGGQQGGTSLTKKGFQEIHFSEDNVERYISELPRPIDFEKPIKTLMKEYHPAIKIDDNVFERYFENKWKYEAVQLYINDTVYKTEIDLFEKVSTYVQTKLYGDVSDDINSYQAHLSHMLSNENKRYIQIQSLDASVEEPTFIEIIQEGKNEIMTNLETQKISIDNEIGKFKKKTEENKEKQEHQKKELENLLQNIKDKESQSSEQSSKLETNEKAIRNLTIKKTEESEKLRTLDAMHLSRKLENLKILKPQLESIMEILRINDQESETFINLLELKNKSIILENEIKPYPKYDGNLPELPNNFNLDFKEQYKNLVDDIIFKKKYENALPNEFFTSTEYNNFLDIKPNLSNKIIFDKYNQFSFFKLTTTDTKEIKKLGTFRATTLPTLISYKIFRQSFEDLKTYFKELEPYEKWKKSKITELSQIDSQNIEFLKSNQISVDSSPDISEVHEIIKNENLKRTTYNDSLTQLKPLLAELTSQLQSYQLSKPFSEINALIENKITDTTQLVIKELKALKETNDYIDKTNKEILQITATNKNLVSLKKRLDGEIIELKESKETLENDIKQLKTEISETSSKLTLLEETKKKLDQMKGGAIDNVIQYLWDETAYKAEYAKMQEIIKTIVDLLMMARFHFVYIQQICNNRLREGNFINNSLRDMRRTFKDIIAAKNGDSIDIIPNFVDTCMKSYCPKYENCFETNENRIPNFQHIDSILIRSIYKKLMGREEDEKTIKQFYKSLQVCAFCVVNISINATANNPPPSPYIDINHFKSLFYFHKNIIFGNPKGMEFVFDDNNSKIIQPSFKPDASKIRLQFVEECKKLVNVIENKYSKGERRAFIQTIQGDPVYVQFKKFTNDFSMKLLRAEDNSINENKIPIYVNLMETFIQFMDNVNATSTIGTLEFMDVFSKYNQTKTLCTVSHASTPESYNMVDMKSAILFQKEAMKHELVSF